MTRTTPESPVQYSVVKQRTGVRLGVLSLLFSIVAPVWLVSGFLLAVGAQGEFVPGAVAEHELLDYVRYFYILVGYFAVPLLFILAVVFGIIAMVRNRRAGAVMGGIGVALVVLFAIAAVVLVGSLITALQSFT